MMEEELDQLLREHGWNLFKRTRHFKRTGSHKEYFYAQKWKKGEIYIGALANLPMLTREKVLNAIAKAETAS